MKYVIFILTLISTISCSTYRFKTVSGHYRTKGGFEWGSCIDLNQDSIFIYKWQSGLIFGKTTGKWKIEGNNLILNSDLQPQLDTLPNYRIIKTEKNNANKITIDLFWTDSLEVLIGASGLMFYNGDTIERQVSDLNGRMIFKKQVADSLKISYIASRDILMNDFNYDYYKIVTIAKNELMYEFFTNEIWKIRGDYLIDKTKNDCYYEKRFYKVE